MPRPVSGSADGSSYGHREPSRPCGSWSRAATGSWFASWPTLCRASRNSAYTDAPMCGIVGYTGPREAGPILMEGLRRLEYRGYDSAGIALVDERGDLFVEKRA